MSEIAIPGRGDPGDRVAKCIQCGGPMQARKVSGNPKLYCSESCRMRAKRSRREEGDRVPTRKRRPLPEFAKDAAWTLRRDVERIERIIADDRFPDNKQQVTALLHSHLSYAAEVCQDLLSRINPTQGE